MDRKILKYTLIAGIAAGVVAAAVILTCRNRGNDVELGPGQTVEELCRAMTEGDFAKAYRLCDPKSMEEYIESYRKSMENMVSRDSSVAEVAVSLLSQTQIHIDDVVKDGDKRSVFYTLTDYKGRSRQKVATAVKEEGEWRVKQITDRD